METECIEDITLIEQPESKQKKTSMLVLEMGKVTVTKDSMAYIVTGGDVKNRISYMSTFESAIQEVSDRLFLGKLSERAEEGKTDLESLIKLVEDHKREMQEKFCLWRYQNVFEFSGKFQKPLKETLNGTQRTQ